MQKQIKTSDYEAILAKKIISNLDASVSDSVQVRLEFSRKRALAELSKNNCSKGAQNPALIFSPSKKHKLFIILLMIAAAIATLTISSEDATDKSGLHDEYFNVESEYIKTLDF